MKTLKLNTSKPSNYAFYDPISKLHLTLTKRKGKIKELNENLKKALKDNTLIILENKKSKKSLGSKSKDDKKAKKDNKKAKKAKKVKKDKKDDKVACQYCGKKYSSKGIKRHESSCDENPDNK
mgnify:CR=1 FL=1